MLKKIKVDNTLSSLQQQVVSSIENLDFGLFWSNSRPEILMSMLDICITYLKANDKNLDLSLLKGLKKQIPLIIDTNYESKKIGKELSNY